MLGPYILARSVLSVRLHALSDGVGDGAGKGFDWQRINPKLLNGGLFYFRA